MIQPKFSSNRDNLFGASGPHAAGLIDQMRAHLAQLIKNTKHTDADTHAQALHPPKNVMEKIPGR